MLSLEEQRQRGDMIETFKIIHNIEDIDPSKFFSFSSNNHNYATRQATVISQDVIIPSFGLVKGPSRIELRMNFFSQRVVNSWNALPSTVKNSESVNAFKNNYDNLI